MPSRSRFNLRNIRKEDYVLIFYIYISWTEQSLEIGSRFIFIGNMKLDQVSVWETINGLSPRGFVVFNFKGCCDGRNGCDSCGIEVNFWLTQWWYR